MVLDEHGSLPYSSVNLNGGLKTSPVLSSMVLDSAEWNLFALVGNRVCCWMDKWMNGQMDGWING